jgi:ATP synthase protein I
VLLGTALGIWLDKTYPQSFSWTLTCLISGLIIGCIIAWNWINTEE